MEAEREQELGFPIDLIERLSGFKILESAQESTRAHESLRPNKRARMNSCQLSFSFGPGFSPTVETYRILQGITNFNYVGK